MKENYKFLNNINFPSDIKKLSENDLKKVSEPVFEYYMQYLTTEDRIFLTRARRSLMERN